MKTILLSLFLATAGLTAANAHETRVVVAAAPCAPVVVRHEPVIVRHEPIVSFGFRAPVVVEAPRRVVYAPAPVVCAPAPVVVRRDYGWAPPARVVYEAPVYRRW